MNEANRDAQIMKKIDKLLIQSFIGPFVVAFMISLFVLTMQYLWVHLDDIIGRGVGFFRLTEIVGYLSVSLFPMALPLGVLISSVMVIGNMSERYELTSMKSAGIPLVRVMMPIGVICFMIAIFSFLSSNYIIPFTNLQFKSRLYDIKNKKATLQLKGGQFNYDFKGFVIYIGKKDVNGRDLEDVIIYDSDNSTSKGLSVTTAKRGEMFTVHNGKYFVMNLYDGVRNQETSRRYVGKEKTHPFVRTTFKKHHMVFDLSQFDEKETDQQLFKSHQSMKSIKELLSGIDSLDLKLEKRYQQLHKSVYRNFYLEMKKDTITFPPIGNRKKKSVNKKDNVAQKQDSLTQVAAMRIDSIKNRAPKELENPIANSSNDTDTIPKVNSKSEKIATDTISDLVQQTNQLASTAATKLKTAAVKKKKRPLPTKSKSSKAYPEQKMDKPLSEYPNMSETFPLKNRSQIFMKARNAARSIHSAVSSNYRTLESEKEKKVKHIYILHSKLTNAFICFLFLFIGGPMGAIIRKGGFGMPLLISIGFFVSFIFLNLLFEKLAESFVLPAVAAAWMPIFILTPIAAILTYQAMSDKQIISFDRISNFFGGLKRYKWVKMVFGAAE